MQKCPRMRPRPKKPRYKAIINIRKDRLLSIVLKLGKTKGGVLCLVFYPRTRPRIKNQMQNLSLSLGGVNHF